MPARARLPRGGLARVTAATIPECQHTGAVLVPSSTPLQMGTRERTLPRSHTVMSGFRAPPPALSPEPPAGKPWLLAEGPSREPAVRLWGCVPCRPSAGSRALLDALYHSSSGGPVTPQPSGPLCRGEVSEGLAETQELWSQAPEQAICHPHQICESQLQWHFGFSLIVGKTTSKALAPKCQESITFFSNLENRCSSGMQTGCFHVNNP